MVGRRLRSELECLKEGRRRCSSGLSCVSETSSTASEAGMGGREGAAASLDLSDEGRFRRRDRLTVCLALSTISSTSLINSGWFHCEETNES